MKPARSITYKDAGVDLHAQAPLDQQLLHLAQRTHSTRVLNAPGNPAALFRLDYTEKLFARNYKEPVLIASTSGVGSKLQVAAELNKFDTVGIDLVAMNVNNLIVQGGEPLFFLNHLALHHLDPDIAAALVKGLSDGCVESGCALLPGETAELPALCDPGDFHLAGFAVGVVEKNKILDGADVQPGDSVIGLASSGLHANGYALVRRVLEKSGAALSDFLPALNTTLADELLRPARIYVKSVASLLARYKIKRVIKAMAHIAAGGLPAALPRILPAGLSIRLKRDAWNPPPIFAWLQHNGPIDPDEMLRVFNMGIGFVIIVRPAFTKPILTHLRSLGEKPFFLGKIKKGGQGLEWS